MGAEGHRRCRSYPVEVSLGCHRTDSHLCCSGLPCVLAARYRYMELYTAFLKSKVKRSAFALRFSLLRKSVFTMLTLLRGSAHEIACTACTAQMHENRGHVPRFSYFVFRFCKRDKGLYAGLYDFTQRHLGHGGRGQIFLTACRLDQVFDQAVHADNLLV